MLDNADILGNIVRDYDFVWCSNYYGLRLACVKQVLTDRKVLNPLYVWSSPQGQPRKIVQSTEMFLFVYSHTYPFDLTPGSSTHLGTERGTSLKSTVLINDPIILKSPLAKLLLEKAQKTKR